MSQCLRGPFHRQIDHGAERLVQAVVRDGGNAMREGLALDVFLYPADVLETFEISLEGPRGGVGRSGDEVAAMQVLVFHSDNNGNGQDLPVVRRGVEETRDDVGALDDGA